MLKCRVSAFSFSSQITFCLIHNMNISKFVIFKHKPLTSTKNCKLKKMSDKAKQRYLAVLLIFVHFSCIAAISMTCFHNIHIFLIINQVNIA